jgi:hypothetical protein
MLLQTCVRFGMTSEGEGSDRLAISPLPKTGNAFIRVKTRDILYFTGCFITLSSLQPDAAGGMRESPRLGRAGGAGLILVDDVDEHRQWQDSRRGGTDG